MGGILSQLFGSAPTLNTGPAQGYLGTLQSLYQNLGQEQNQASNVYNQDLGQDQKAANAYDQYLQSNPGTNPYDAGLTATAEKNAAAGAAKAGADVSQSLASRGIGPGSSMGAGATASIDTALAANNAGVQAGIGQANQQQHNANLGTLANMWANRANTAFGRNAQIQGAQTGVAQDQFNDADTLATQQYSAQQAQAAAQQQLMMQLGQMYAQTMNSAATAAAGA